MQLLRLQLRNVKSYGDEPETVDFADGVNFIAGPNGSGKSTQMEAIGYALFDTCPYTKEEFVRRGAKTGIINVWLDDDGEAFRVERKFGATNSWIVYDRDDIALHEKLDDVKRFLRERLRVSDLESVFKNIIGVPQGMFTALFKLTGAPRKKILDGIIGVDAYSDAALARKDVKGKLLTAAIAAVDRRIGEAKVFLDEHRDDPAKLDKVVGQLAELDLLVTELASREAGLQKTAAEFESIRLRRDGLDREIETSGGRLVDRRRLLTIARDEEAQAEQARAVVTANEPGHRAWVGAERDLVDKLEPRRRRRDEVAAKSRQAETKLRVADNAISMIDSHLAELERQEAARAAAADQARSAKPARQAAAKELFDLAVRVRATYDALEGELRSFDTKREEFVACLDRVREIDTEITSLGTPDPGASSAADARGRLAEFRTRLAELEADRSHLAKQICPFLLQSCDRVGPEVFTAQIDALVPRIAAAEKAVEAAEAAERLKERVVSAGRARAKEVDRARAIREPRDSDFDGLAREWKEESLQRGLALDANERETRRAQDAAVRAQSDAEAAERELDAAEKTLDALRAGLAAKRAERATHVKARERAMMDHAKCANALRDYAALDDEFADTAARKASNAAAHETWLKHDHVASQLEERRERVRATGDDLAQAVGRLEHAKTKRAAIVFDEEESRRVAGELASVHDARTEAVMGRQHLQSDRAWLESVVLDINRRKASVENDYRELRTLDRFRALLDDLWQILRDAGPRISRRLLHGISARSNRILEAMQDEPAKLAWGDEYQVRLRRDGVELPFHALSGGEQMSVALAIQMAMARIFAQSSFCIFDEPTVHLDELRKDRLAKAIKDAQAEAKFRQVFVVSHDDSFAPFVDHEIKVTKEHGRSVASS